MSVGKWVDLRLRRHLAIDLASALSGSGAPRVVHFREVVARAATNAPVAQTSAERQRRYRQRKRAGAVPVRIDIPPETLALLTAKGWLAEGLSAEELSGEIGDLVQCAAEDRLIWHDLERYVSVTSEIRDSPWPDDGAESSTGIKPGGADDKVEV